MNTTQFWQLQKAANLTNAQCAEYLGISKRTVERYRANQIVAPKSALLALEYRIKQNEHP